MTTITTLIPAYKPEYLGETLMSLRRQSFRDFRVIVSDDSRDGAITTMLRDGRFSAATDGLNVLAVRGPCNARLNHMSLLDRWAGSTPFVHLLMDDDVIFPGFYQQHLAAHATGDYGVSVSARWLSQDDSRPAWSLPIPSAVANSPLRAVPLGAEQVFQSVVPRCDNWLGELSNMVFAADAAARYPRPPSEGLSYYGLLDVGAVLESVCHRPMVFLNEHLGVFRQHAQQTTHGVGQHNHRVAMLVWAATALHAWAEQRISAQDVLAAIGTTVKRCLNLYGEEDAVMNRFYTLLQEEGRSLPGLHAAFTAFWLELLASNPSTAPAPATTHAPVATREVEPA
jgi:hypothetical protein